MRAQLGTGLKVMCLRVVRARIYARVCVCVVGETSQ